VLWEYQLILEKIDYAVCTQWSSSSQSYAGRVCSMNFAVTDSYMMHQGVWFSTTPDTDLRTYRNLAWMPILDERMYTSVGIIEKNNELQDRIAELFYNFWIRQQWRATQRVNRLWNTSIIDSRLRKVPNSEIYLINWDITLRNVYTQQAKSWTLIVNNGSVSIEWDFMANGMIIVPNWTIEFVPIDCDITQRVQGVYITKRGFISSILRNDNLDAKQWCLWWWLRVDGLLIWPTTSIERLVKARRSWLNQWFNVTIQSQVLQIMQWASLLLRTNTSLWNDLPPWATILKDLIQIKK